MPFDKNVMDCRGMVLLGKDDLLRALGLTNSSPTNPGPKMVWASDANGLVGWLPWSVVTGDVDAQVNTLSGLVSSLTQLVANTEDLLTELSLYLVEQGIEVPNTLSGKL